MLISVWETLAHGVQGSASRRREQSPACRWEAGAGKRAGLRGDGGGAGAAVTSGAGRAPND